MVEELLKKYFYFLNEDMEIRSAWLASRAEEFRIKSTKYNLEIVFVIDYQDNDCGFELFATKKIDNDHIKSISNMRISNSKEVQKQLRKFLRHKYGTFERMKDVNIKLEGYIEFYSKYLFENLSSIA
jgi:hypothetical protein